MLKGQETIEEPMGLEYGDFSGEVHGRQWSKANKGKGAKS